MHTADVIDGVGTAIEVMGVAVMVIGAIGATVAFLVAVWRQHAFRPMYQAYRRGLGRSILLGLEFLVAADIIKTVAISPTLENVAVLGLIVLIRIALSFSLEVEIDGHWPWQGNREAIPGADM